MPKIIKEFRGVRDAVYAEVLQDDSTGFVTGEVKDFAGVSEISRSTESSSEAHYYDDIPAIVINSTGADEVTISSSAIPLDILAEITGQYYDATTGMMVEQTRDEKYFAFGYVTEKSDGTRVLVWRLKGSFSIPDQENSTIDDSTDANGQEITYTGIATTHKFTKTGVSAKAVNLDESLGLVDTANFFSTVQTPDTISPSGSVAVTGVGLAPSSVTITEGETATLVATVYPTNATNKNVTWAVTTGDSYASVDNGVVTALAAGSATVTVTTVDGSYTDTCAVTVEAAV